MCAWCISKLNCKKIRAPDPFIIKIQKNIRRYIQANKHQKGANFAFRCENASRNVSSTFVDAVNQLTRYDRCSYCLRKSKGAVNQVNNGSKSKGKVRLMSLEVEMHKVKHD